MIRNYLSVALRQIRKNKSYIIINTFGLGVALACCITSYLLLAFNLEFDNHFDQDLTESLYIVHTQYERGKEDISNHQVTPIAMGPAIFNDISGVSSYTRFFNEWGFVRYREKSFSEGVSFADSSFVDLIPLEVIKGNLNSFTSLNTIILTDEMAKKIFVDENPIGKVLIMNFVNQKRIQFVVGAVVKKFPINSTITMRFLARMEHVMDIYNLPSNEWGDWHDPSLLLSIEDKENVSTIEKKLGKYVSLRNVKKEDAKVVKFHLKNFNNPSSQDDVDYGHFDLKMSNIPIIIFVSMAGVILLIACFNLTNTSVALATKRFKEVGVRKVVGASKWQIITQFLFEMIIIVVLALIFGLGVSKFIVAEFMEMWDMPFGLSEISGINLFIALIILVFVASTLAGLYPALLSTRFQPVLLMKSQAKIKGSNWFTKALVTAQFTLSIVVLINGIVFTQNTKFQEKLKYGFDYEDVLAVFIQDESEYELLKGRAMANPKIKQVAITHHQLGMSSYPFPIKVDTSEYQVQHIEVGENFFEVMGLKLSEGRFSNINNVTDEHETIVVNKTFLEKTGIKDPLNTTVKIRGQRKKIVGVVENHIDNLFRSKGPEPFVFYGSKRNEYQVMLVKSNPSDLSSVKASMKKIWDEAYPEKPFESEFQEEILLGGLRSINANMKKIFIFLTILGALLSVSGIYALASINVERRTKEIGIRKALGGSIKSIITLLSRQFLIILFIAAVIGGTVGYIQTDLLLDEIYAYHIDIKIWAVIAGIAIVSAAGIFTTTMTIFRAAKVDPIKSLRDE